MAKPDQLDIDAVERLIVDADAAGKSIKSYKIEDALGIAGHYVRGIVRVLRRRGVLIYANRDGYRLAKTADEVLEIITDLQCRARSMLATAEQLMIRYKQMKQKEQLELFGRQL